MDRDEFHGLVHHAVNEAIDDRCGIVNKQLKDATNFLTDDLWPHVERALREQAVITSHGSDV